MEEANGDLTQRDPGQQAQNRGAKRKEHMQKKVCFPLPTGAKGVTESLSTTLRGLNLVSEPPTTGESMVIWVSQAWQLRGIEITFN